MDAIETPEPNPLEEKFEEFVADAIDHIPDMYQDKMKSIAIVVEDRPTQHQREKLGLKCCEQLYGLYEGVPLTKRGGTTLQIQPDVITIFKYPMLHTFRTEDALKKQIYKTLWHEVAHYFGLDHDQIHAAENNSTN